MFAILLSILCIGVLWFLLGKWVLRGDDPSGKALLIGLSIMGIMVLGLQASNANAVQSQPKPVSLTQAQLQAQKQQAHAAAVAAAKAQATAAAAAKSKSQAASVSAVNSNPELHSTPTLTSNPDTDITTNTRTTMLNLSMAPVNINDCLTASHIGGGLKEGAALIQWAGVNKSCLAAKLAESEENALTAIMLKCSIPTYRDAVAYTVAPDGSVKKVKGNKQMHCIERDVQIADAMLDELREYVDSEIEKAELAARAQCDEKIERCEALAIK